MLGDTYSNIKDKEKKLTVVSRSSIILIRRWHKKIHQTIEKHMPLM